MFFWKIKKVFSYCLKKLKKASLRACHEQIDPNKSDILYNPKRKKKRIFKRTFSLTSSCHQASMSLEASLSFSFFFLFMINIFSIIFLFATYAKDLTQMQQKGKKLAAYAYVTEGMYGANEENICLQKTERLSLAFAVFPIPYSKMHIRCVVKPWTGYDVTKYKNRAEEEAIVYMTEYGTVYHRNRSCTHLSLSVQAVSSAIVNSKRNESGECYFPCEFCNENGIATIVFITSHGNRYHKSTKCKGLKRSVKSFSLSEVKGVNPCKKCG